MCELTERQQQILCDPQTSGGLLVMVKAAEKETFLMVAKKAGLLLEAIGYMQVTDASPDAPLVLVE